MRCPTLRSLVDMLGEKLSLCFVHSHETQVLETCGLLQEEEEIGVLLAGGESCYCDF